MSESVPIEQKILSKAAQDAQEFRLATREVGTTVVNVMSSPGSGKTALLCALSDSLRQAGKAVAAIAGDCATDNDARRLAPHVDWVRQVETVGLCHLEARMLMEYLDDIQELAPDYLFIENVGNLVCPVDFDLGESVRIALVATTEGEDKPLKYPQMFNASDVCVISKTDLADVVGFDLRLARELLETVSGGAEIIETSAKTKVGISELIGAIDIHSKQHY
jgi:hydrogenase nickel incorporation protein HypB